MLKRYTTNYAIFCAFIDGVLVAIALKLANLIRPELSPLFEFVKDIQNPQPIENWTVLVISLIWLLVFLQMGVYDPEKNFRIVDEFYNLIIASAVSIILISGFLYLINSEISRLLFLVFAFFSFTFLILHRILYRLLRSNSNSHSSTNVKILIAGAGVVGHRLKKNLEKYHYLGYQVVGFLDDDEQLIRENPEVIAGIDQAPKIIQKLDIEMLIIALPKWADQRINQLVEAVHRLPVQVWVVPDYFSLMLVESSISDIGNIPMINLRAPALSTKERVTKRIFDLVMTVPILILSLPLFLLIAFLIKIDSKGPILYRSIRLKESGRPFKMLKFRTMVKNAHKHLSEVMQEDEKGNIIHKLPNDPRVTKVGKFLRKTSLDELPQLINIIKGDMSLIGPRPELPEMVKYYKPWQYKRFTAPQGLTGWWQINGRSDKPMHLHTEDDLYYIKNYSIWLDLQILIKTVLIVLRGKGAY